MVKTLLQSYSIFIEQMKKLHWYCRCLHQTLQRWTWRKPLLNNVLKTFHSFIGSVYLKESFKCVLIDKGVLIEKSVIIDRPDSKTQGSRWIEPPSTQGPSTIMCMCNFNLMNQTIFIDLFIPICMFFVNLSILHFNLKYKLQCFSPS